MFFTITAGVLDTLLIKTSVFVLSQSFNLLHMGGSMLYYSYMGHPLTHEDLLQIEIEVLKEDIEMLKRTKTCENAHNKENDYGIIGL